MNRKGVFPTVEEIDREILRVQKKRKRTVWRTAILIMATSAVFVSVFFFMRLVSFVKVSGNSMEPALWSGDVVVCIKTVESKRGDIVAIERDGVLLMKRVIATEGDTVSITQDGRVQVNDVLLDEPYITHYSLGNSDISYPVTVPKNACFVMGDNRRLSLDSRNSAVGMIETSEIRSQIKAVIWPAYRIRIIP